MERLKCIKFINLNSPPSRPPLTLLVSKILSLKEKSYLWIFLYHKHDSFYCWLNLKTTKSNRRTKFFFNFRTLDHKYHVLFHSSKIIKTLKNDPTSRNHLVNPLSSYFEITHGTKKNTCIVYIRMRRKVYIVTPNIQNRWGSRHIQSWRLFNLKPPPISPPHSPFLKFSLH